MQNIFVASIIAKTKLVSGNSRNKFKFILFIRRPVIGNFMWYNFKRCRSWEHNYVYQDNIEEKEMEKVVRWMKEKENRMEEKEKKGKEDEKKKMEDRRE